MSDNRRRHPRFTPAECEVLLHRPSGPFAWMFGAGENLAVALHDASEGGLRLTVRDRLPEGARVTVRFVNATFGDDFRAEGTIAWCVPHAASRGHYLAGVEFTRIDDAHRRKLGHMCRYYTSSQVKVKTEVRRRADE
jgi:c-di-GMP-binding flagellar brake protein YcgR